MVIRIMIKDFIFALKKYLCVLHNFLVGNMNWRDIEIGEIDGNLRHVGLLQVPTNRLTLLQAARLKNKT